MFLGLLSHVVPPAAPKTALSEYGFFVGNLADLKPADRVFPYEVNAPLFSDYAEKARFIALPEGGKLTYSDSAVFQVPEGAVLIKNFLYPTETGYPKKGRRIVETRLLLREANGWKALTYVWNATQTDAVLEVAGASFPMSWTDAGGKKQQIDYVVPNLNQCKGCHSYDGQFTPIGITARQLNREENGANQLLAWGKAGMLELPEGFVPDKAPRLADYRQPHTNQTGISAAARAYLDANCGHCHNPHGPANTSGMFLNIDEQDPERLGVNKTPVAAGRGSGNRRFGIVPGKPNESILVYRMENGDPGIRMPELGRQLAHKEGIALIRDWIRSMPSRP